MKMAWMVTADGVSPRADLSAEDDALRRYLEDYGYKMTVSRQWVVETPEEVAAIQAEQGLTDS